MSSGGREQVGTEREVAPSDAAATARPDASVPVVGIGASAGGLAAFQAFFSGLPRDRATGMAFVLVQHLAPEHHSHAAQAIPEGHLSANEVRVETSVDDAGKVIVEVRDTGVCIAADNMRRLFDPFFTTKAVGQGMGLGLSICHRLVTELGGTIAVQSSVGEGTVVRVVPPVAPPTDAETAHVVQKPAQPPRGRVLVIDDEVPVANLVRRVLRNLHAVVVAPSPSAARPSSIPSAIHVSTSPSSRPR